MYSRLGVYHLAHQARHARRAATMHRADRRDRDVHAIAYPNELAMFLRLGIVTAVLMALAALVIWGAA